MQHTAGSLQRSGDMFGHTQADAQRKCENWEGIKGFVAKSSGDRLLSVYGFILLLSKVQDKQDEDILTQTGQVPKTHPVWSL